MAQRQWGQWWRRSGAVLETPALVSGLDDVAVVDETIEGRGGHLGVVEDARPLAEGEVRGDDDRGLLVEPADEVEQELAAGLGEGQVAELVKDDEVLAGEIVGHAALAAGSSLCLQLVDEVDHVEEAPPCAASDGGTRDGDGQVGLAGSGPADQHHVALVGEEVAAGEVAHQGLVDECVVEHEVVDVLGEGQRHYRTDHFHTSQDETTSEQPNSQASSISPQS